MYPFLPKQTICAVILANMEAAAAAAGSALTSSSPSSLPVPPPEPLQRGLCLYLCLCLACPHRPRSPLPWHAKRQLCCPLGRCRASCDRIGVSSSYPSRCVPAGAAPPPAICKIYSGRVEQKVGKRSVGVRTRTKRKMENVRELIIDTRPRGIPAGRQGQVSSHASQLCHLQIQMQNPQRQTLLSVPRQRTALPLIRWGQEQGTQSRQDKTQQD